MPPRRRRNPFQLEVAEVGARGELLQHVLGVVLKDALVEFELGVEVRVGARVGGAQREGGVGAGSLVLEVRSAGVVVVGAECVVGAAREQARAGLRAAAPPIGGRVRSSRSAFAMTLVHFLTYNHNCDYNAGGTGAQVP